MIKLSKNRRYLETSEGTPFFWLGDTAWELIHRLTKEEILMYLDDRQVKGFNVIQTVILAEQDGINTPNAYGHKPLINNDPTNINEDYFELVDFVLEETAQRKMLVGLLPTWGDKIELLSWGQGPLIFTPENAFEYGKILGERYRNSTNLLWIIGGDRIPENDDQRAIYNAMAAGIKSADPDHLMSYHPLGTMTASDHFNEPWLDIDMFQSGHDNSCREYEYVEACLKKETPRPVINGEARYENIPNAFWMKESDDWLDDYDARVSAWWSMLAGAAGYTYGCNDVWQMYQTGRNPVIKARTDWQEAIHLPGSRQMGMMKKFFEQLPWQKLVPCPDLILNDPNPETEEYIMCAATSDRNIAVFYTPYGRPLTVDLQQMNSSEVDCWWYNPRSGRFKTIGQKKNGRHEDFTPWSNGRGSDFILLVADKNIRLNIQVFKNSV